MSDLICRKTMMRCQTPGMCSPHGGCNPQAPVALTGNADLDQLRHDCDKWEALYRAEHASCTRVLDTLTGFRTERDQLKAQVEQLEGKKALCKLHEKDSCLECMWPPLEKSEVVALKAEIEALRSQVAALQSDANSWQSGYDKGRSMGTKTALDERDQLRKDAERLSYIEKEWFYATEGGNQEFTYNETWTAPGESLRQAIDAEMSKGEKV